MSARVAISQSIKELRFLMPQAPSTLKSFVLKSYQPIKQAHPHLPVLIRECSGIQPTVVMRLEKGVEVKKHVTDFTEAEIKNLLSTA